MVNTILDGVLKQKKRSGNGAAVVHKQPISDDAYDWQQIMDLFKDVGTTDNPRLMTYYVWVLVASHFCLCARSDKENKLQKEVF